MRGFIIVKLLAFSLPKTEQFIPLKNNFHPCCKGLITNKNICIFWCQKEWNLSIWFGRCRRLTCNFTSNKILHLLKPNTDPDYLAKEVNLSMNQLSIVYGSSLRLMIMQFKLWESLKRHYAKMLVKTLRSVGNTFNIV